MTLISIFTRMTLQFNANLLDVVPTRLESVQADVLDGVLEVAKDLHAMLSFCIRMDNGMIDGVLTVSNTLWIPLILCMDENNSPQEEGEHTSCCRATERNINQSMSFGKGHLVVEQDIVVQILVAEAPHKLCKRIVKRKDKK